MTSFARSMALALSLQLAAGCSVEPDRSPVDGNALANAPAAAAAPASEPARQGEERLVLAFGDSLYAGYGLDPGQAFPAVLERELEARGIPAEVVNAGVSGDTTAGGRARLAFTLDGLSRKPDLAVVGLGGNDLLRGLDPAETRRNLTAILEELDRRGIPVMLTGMIAPRNLGNAYVRQFDAIYPELAAKYGAELDPFFLDGVITNPDLLLGDGIHPNAEGIRRIAARLAPEIAEELEPAAG